MKNTIRLIALTLCLMFVATFMVACDKGANDNTNGTTSAPETTATAELILDESGAKEIVWADLCIQESAAENLTTKPEGNSYVIAFKWSGFDYQYTVDGATGEITEVLFDGDVI